MHTARGSHQKWREFGCRCRRRRNDGGLRGWSKGELTQQRIWLQMCTLDLCFVTAGSLSEPMGPVARTLCVLLTTIHGFLLFHNVHGGYRLCLELERRQSIWFWPVMNAVKARQPSMQAREIGDQDRFPTIVECSQGLHGLSNPGQSSRVPDYLQGKCVGFCRFTGERNDLVLCWKSG